MARQRRRRGGGHRSEDSRAHRPRRPQEGSETRSTSGRRGQASGRRGPSSRGKSRGGEIGSASRIPSTVLFRGVTTLSFDGTSRQRVDVLVAHGTIQEIRRHIRAPLDAEIVDGSRRVLVPGLVDTSSRLTADALPGFDAALDPAQPRDEWLRRSTMALDEAALISTAFAATAEALRAGTTCVFDVHESPNHIYGALGRIKDVALTLGLRSVLAYGVSENETAGAVEQQLDVSRQAAAFGGGETLRMALGTGRLDEVSDETLAQLAAIRTKHATPFVTQLGRFEDEAALHQSKFGKSGAARLLELNLVDDHTVIRTGSWLDAADRELLANAGATFAATPRADFLSGRPRVDLAALGTSGTLGTAEVEAHMLRELRLANDLALAAGERLPAERILGLITQGQALASRIFGTTLGKIEEGAAADLVLLEYDPTFPITDPTVAHHVLRGVSSARVLATMVNGRFLVRDGEITTLDAAELCAVLRRGSAELHERLFDAPYPGLAEQTAADAAQEEEEEDNDQDDTDEEIEESDPDLEDSEASDDRAEDMDDDEVDDDEEDDGDDLDEEEGDEADDDSESDLEGDEDEEPDEDDDPLAEEIDSEPIDENAAPSSATSLEADEEDDDDDEEEEEDDLDDEDDDLDEDDEEEEDEDDEDDDDEDDDTPSGRGGPFGAGIFD